MEFVRYGAVFRLLECKLREIAGGRGQLVVVRGGPASGKTKLLHEFANAAAESNAVFLGASASRDESMLRLGVIDQLCHSAGIPAGVAERVWDLLATGRDEAQTAREICGVFLELARDRPLVIGIDDVHFADTQSQQVLLYLQRRLSSARVLLIVNEWDRSQPINQRFGSELARRPHHRVRLARLTQDDVAVMIAPSVGAAATRLAPQFHRISGGNALLVSALVVDFCAADAPPDAGFQDERERGPAVGMAFRHAVLACLHRWDTRLLDVAHGLAVLGQFGGPEKVGRLIGAKTQDVEEAYAILTEAGLVVSGRFRHDAVREALMGALPDDQRVHIHLRAADLLHRWGCAAIDIAGHLVLAGRVSEDWGVSLLCDAAEAALVADRVRLAIRCLELALGACPDGPQRTLIIATLARAQWRVNPAKVAVHLPVLRAAMIAGELTARDAIVVLRAALLKGDVDDIADLLAVAQDRGVFADPLIDAELRLSHHLVYGSPHGNFPAVDPESVADPWAQAVLSLDTMWTHGFHDTGAMTSAEQILRSYCLGDNTLSIVSAALLALAYGNQIDKAAQWCDSLIDEATSRGSVTWRALFGAIRADIALRRGDLVTARTHVETALALMPARSWGVLIGYPLSLAVTAHTRLEQHEEAAEVLASVPVPEAMFETVGGMRYLLARGHHLLGTDRALAAVRDFKVVGRLAKEHEVDLPALLPWRSGVAEASLRLNRMTEAREFLTQQLDRAAFLDSHTKGLSLRLLAATSERSRRPSLLNLAVSALQTAGDRYELARALADLSEAQREVGDHDRAQRTTRLAAQEAKACRSEVAELFAKPKAYQPAAAVDSVDRPRRASGVAAPSLSKAEHRVAVLAAKGHSNREIASALYITVSTVEQHLTRIYRKLDANSRTDLSTVLPATATGTG